MRIFARKPSLGPREERELERQRAQAASVEAQAFFTAVMTDTYLEDEDEGGEPETGEEADDE